jgi:hypothetical protein
VQHNAVNDSRALNNMMNGTTDGVRAPPMTGEQCDEEEWGMIFILGANPNLITA